MRSAESKILTSVNNNNGTLQIHGMGCTIGRNEEILCTYRNSTIAVSIPLGLNEDETKQYLQDIMVNIDRENDGLEKEEILKGLIGREL